VIIALPSCWFRAARGIRGPLFAAGVILSSALRAEDQPAPISPGTVIDAVRCADDESQSYALYVPSNYRADRKWPVIYCFDPGAKGARPVQKLAKAAERFGYIVAGSLNSKNGPWADNHAAASAMTRDVSRHFSIDPQRVYTTGLSGGARVATALGLSGFAKGVIGCGAGFPQMQDGLPKHVGFAYIGVVGEEDFNYIEMVRLQRDLEERGATHRLYVFPGGHEWPPEEVFVHAVAWLELQAMRRATQETDAAFAEAYFREWRTLVSELPLHRRADELKALSRDFPEYASQLHAELVELQTDPSFQQEVRRERELLSREEEWIADTAAAALENASKRRSFAIKLRNKAETTDTRERQMYRRVIFGYLSITQQTVRGLVETGDLERAASLLEMSNALRPGHARTLYDLATVRARLKDKKGAFATLGEAIAAGFVDLSRLDSDEAWAAYRADPELGRILGRGKNMDHDGVVMLPALQISAALESVELRLFYLPHHGSNDAPSLSFLRVETVRPGTTAAMAGVIVGMEVTAIDNVRVRGLTEAELREVMNRTVRGELTLRVREHARARERELRIPIGARRR
jgi:dienelactone hydrolase